MARRPVSRLARATASAHRRTRSRKPANPWSARPWSSLMISIPPRANRYARSASPSADSPSGFNAVQRSGRCGTPSSARSPGRPNRGPRNDRSIDSGRSSRSARIPALMLMFPKSTFRSCVRSRPDNLDGIADPRRVASLRPRLEGFDLSKNVGPDHPVRNQRIRHLDGLLQTDVPRLLVGRRLVAGEAVDHGEALVGYGKEDTESCHRAPILGAARSDDPR